MTSAGVRKNVRISGSLSIQGAYFFFYLDNSSTIKNMIVRLQRYSHRKPNETYGTQNTSKKKINAIERPVLRLFYHF